MVEKHNPAPGLISELNKLVVAAGGNFQASRKLRRLCGDLSPCSPSVIKKMRLGSYRMGTLIMATTLLRLANQAEV